MITIINYRELFEDIPLREMINCTRIWISAVENEMEGLLSAEPSLLWVENNVLL